MGIAYREGRGVQAPAERVESRVQSWLPQYATLLRARWRFLIALSRAGHNGNLYATVCAGRQSFNVASRKLRRPSEARFASADPNVRRATKGKS